MFKDVELLDMEDRKQQMKVDMPRVRTPNWGNRGSQGGGAA